MYELLLQDREIYAGQQIQALEAIYTGFNKGLRRQALGGAAGTGKSTLMKTVANSARRQKHRVHQMCPTGKAAVRLKERTGYPATTIHSPLYGGAEQDESGELIWHDPGLSGKPGDLIIVDEASMVGKSLAYDLEQAANSKGMSILYVGDPFQLSPVGDEPGVNFASATFTLTQIHRQALDNPILNLATEARIGDPVRWLRENGPRLKGERLRLFHGLDSFVDRAVECVRNAVDFTAVCYTNEFRHDLNQRIRLALNHKDLLCPGDRIVIRTNNAALGLYNGETYIVDKVEFYNDTRVLGPYMLVHLLGRKTPVKIPNKYFGCDKNTWWNAIKTTRRAVTKNYVHAQYGFALTAHSCQGSEWDTVLHYWEPAIGRLLQWNPAEANRLLYTTWTRAANNLELYRG